MPASIVECRSSSPTKSDLIVNFDGVDVFTTVTSTPSVVRRWLYKTKYVYRRHLHHLVVGLGVQWVPEGRGKRKPAATLQICVGTRCLIFQLCHSPTVPRILRRFLSDSDYTFVGLWNQYDSLKLRNSKHRLECKEPIDMRHHAVAEDTGEHHSLESRETIVRECLGYQVEFPLQVSRSSWDATDLSHDQISLACVDAYASFLLGEKFKAWDIDG